MGHRSLAALALLLARAAAFEPWDASPHVQEVDYAEASARPLIQGRAPGAPPLVIRNALTGDGLEPLLKFGKLKTLQN